MQRSPLLLVLFFLPEMCEIERKLPMVLDGQEYDGILPHQVENGMILQQAFPKDIVFLDEPTKTFH